MPALINVAPLHEIVPGSGTVYTVAGTELALFNLEGEIVAIENQCPHAGASLGLGTLEGSVVTCPWHAWKFDLASGERVGHSLTRLRRFPVSIDAGAVWIDPATLPGKQDAKPDDGIKRYLVRYGALGWVGCFGSIEAVECAHRERVVIHTARGLEIGEVLVSGANGKSELSGERPAGEVVRRATPDDERLLRDQGAAASAAFDACRAALAEQAAPVEIVDYEPMLKGAKVVLYYLGDVPPAFEVRIRALGMSRGVEIALQPVIDPEPAPRSSGGGCGAGGCGCGAG